ncbi:hypothetical protein Dimus_008153, partial [Dionaea muscipula]
MPRTFVEFDSSINCDGDSLEMCDEVTYLPFVKFHDLVPHMIDSWSGQALDGFKSFKDPGKLEEVKDMEQ